MLVSAVASVGAAAGVALRSAGASATDGRPSGIPPDCCIATPEGYTARAPLSVTGVAGKRET